MITNVSDKEIAQAAEIEALRQEITAWSVTVDNLAAERDALKADAARYQWLRDQEDTSPVFCMYGRNGAWGECGHSEIYGDLLDSTVDAAIKEANHD